MAPELLIQAASHHLDGTLPDAEAVALAAAVATEPAVAAELARQQIIDRCLRELPRPAFDAAAVLARLDDEQFAARVMDRLEAGTGRRERQQMRRKQRSGPSFMRWAMAALVLLAFGAGGWWWMQDATVAEAKLTAADPGVTVMRGTQSLTASPGLALRVDDRLRCPAGASATVIYADGSRLILTDAAADFGSGHTGVAAGKGLLLSAGRIEATISPQPAGLPFVIATPQARVTVIGTRFTVTMSGDVTRLAVEKGRVRFDRLGDHSTVEVGAGERAEASASSPVQAASAATTLRPVDDAFVQDGNSATSNFAVYAFLDTKNDAPGFARKAFLKFDLSGVHGPVTGATLRLFGGSNEPGPLTVAAHGVADTAWTEATITWNNQPAIGSATLASTVVPPSSDEGWYTWDLTAFIQSERRAGRNLVSIALTDLEVSHTGGCGFRSKEAQANQPELVVTVPASAAPASSIDQ